MHRPSTKLLNWEFLGELTNRVRGLFTYMTTPLNVGFTTADVFTLPSSPKVWFLDSRGIVGSKEIKIKIKSKK